MSRHSILAGLALLTLNTATSAADLLIENVTIVSPERSQPLPHQFVLIRDERIAQIAAKPITAPGAQRIDGRGKFLTPGLMDSHVHVSTPAGLPWDPASPQLQPLVDP